jgi:hypothetical protein
MEGGWRRKVVDRRRREDVGGMKDGDGGRKDGGRRAIEPSRYASKRAI